MSPAPGIVIASRMSSTRLPGKAMERLGDTTVLGSCIERCQRTGLRVVVATTNAPEDTSTLRLYAESQGARCYSGSERNVLSRLAFAAKANRIDPLIRITGDCPLPSPSLILTMLAYAIDGPPRLVTNVHPDRTFVRGLDVEIVPLALLEGLLADQTLTDDEKEHVTLGLYRRMDPSEYVTIRNDDGMWPGADKRQICVDTKEDLAYVRGLFPEGVAA